MICYAFSVPASAFVSQVNRATSRDAAHAGGAGRARAAEGVGQDARSIRSSRFVSASPISNSSGSATTRSIRCNRRRRSRSWSTRASRRATRRGRSWGWRRRRKAAPALGKYNHNHDERGRFATADDAIGPEGRNPSAAQPKGIRLASNSPALPGASPPPHQSGANVSLLSSPDRDICIARCSDLALPTNDFGIQFRRCILARESGGNSGFPEWDRRFR